MIDMLDISQIPVFVSILELSDGEREKDTEKML